jgi:hypothetical protein
MIYYFFKSHLANRVVVYNLLQETSYYSTSGTILIWWILWWMRISRSSILRSGLPWIQRYYWLVFLCMPGANLNQLGIDFMRSYQTRKLKWRNLFCHKNWNQLTHTDVQLSSWRSEEINDVGNVLRTSHARVRLVSESPVTPKLTYALHSVE